MLHSVTLYHDRCSVRNDFIYSKSSVTTPLASFAAKVNSTAPHSTEERGGATRAHEHLKQHGLKNCLMKTELILTG